MIFDIKVDMRNYTATFLLEKLEKVIKAIAKVLATELVSFFNI